MHCGLCYRKTVKLDCFTRFLAAGTITASARQNIAEAIQKEGRRLSVTVRPVLCYFCRRTVPHRRLASPQKYSPGLVIACERFYELDVRYCNSANTR